MGPPTMTGYRERVAVPHSDGLTGSERVGPKHRGGTAVEYFAGIDVSFAESGLKFTRIGLEAGPLSQWLHAGLTAAGGAVILIETRHLKAALGAMKVKTDRNDARGMAQLVRMGWFRPVHVKTVPAQEIRALLTARDLLQRK